MIVLWSLKTFIMKDNLFLSIEAVVFVLMQVPNKRR